LSCADDQAPPTSSALLRLIRALEQDRRDGPRRGFGVCAEPRGERVVEPQRGEAVDEAPGGGAGEGDAGVVSGVRDGADPP
jgi:hypothetical protein